MVALGFSRETEPGCVYVCVSISVFYKELTHAIMEDTQDEPASYRASGIVPV